MHTERLAAFSYAYTHGPIDTEAEFRAGFPTGNCRRAVQDYYLKRYGRFLVPDEIYIPQSYESFGEFVVREGETLTPERLAAGDVIYAQKRRSRSGKELALGAELYDSRDEWLFSLHSVVYLGLLDDEAKALLPEGVPYKDGVTYVWHSTVVDGGTVLWDWDTFMHYYAPVSAKRFV